MDWFEQLTGFSPDAGTGTLEAMLAAIVGAAVIASAVYISSRRRTRAAR
ncbi:MAG: hypothetical protein ACYC9W_03290 [Candidatus Limnocylindria bacterium]